MDPIASHETSFVTPAGVRVSRTATPFDPVELTGLTRQVDSRRGGVLSSGMEYPGRYSRWQFGYVDPCIEIAGHGRRVTATALNERGAVLLPVLGAPLRPGAGHEAQVQEPGPGLPGVTVVIPEAAGTFTEEERSRRPTVFSALREVIAAFAGPDSHLGLYGAFGYARAFQFEPVRQRHQRPAAQRDLVLHLPDELYVLDRKRETAIRYRYEFDTGAGSTCGMPRRGRRAGQAAVRQGRFVRGGAESRVLRRLQFAGRLLRAAAAAQSGTV